MMTRLINKYFRMYEGEMTDEEQWEDTQEIVHLCMVLLFGLSLIKAVI